MCDNGDNTSKGGSAPSRTPPRRCPNHQGWSRPWRHHHLQRRLHTATRRPLNPRSYVQPESASHQPAPHDYSFSNVAPISKGTPSVAGGANFSQSTKKHSTPHPFLPQGHTFICFNMNLSFRVLARVVSFRGTSRQPVVPTIPCCSRPQNRPILRASRPPSPSTNGTALEHILLQ